MADQKSKFTNKISPLIEGQVPDFVQADHPVFVDFVKDYFSFLEAGRLTLDITVNYIAQETKTSAYILNEEDDRIVTEIGEGTTGLFTVGETVTGGTSKATATVLVEDSRNTYLYISGQQLFQTGETITGTTSGSSATLVEYRGNPIQNIQQMLEYADVDNTLYDFLDQMRDSFMESIPEILADGVSKRNLIKNIKDLYAAKGSSEGHKLFMRILLGETADIFYPNTYMLKNSGGDWNQKTIMRVAAFAGVEGQEVENQIITGQSSGATAIVVNSLVTQQGAVSVTEFEIANIVGTFIDGEVVTGTSTIRDLDVSFTIDGIVASTTLVNDGILHTDREDVTLESIGNNAASIQVDGIAEGSVSEVIVDDAGSLYEVGDTVTFTAQTVDTNVNAATGFVSMIGGGIQLESGTLDDSTLTDDAILLEVGSTVALEPFSIQLEASSTDKFIGDGTTTAFTLTNLTSTTDTIQVTVDNNLLIETAKDGKTNWTASGTTLTFTTAPIDKAQIFVYNEANENLVLDGTDGSSTDANHDFLTDTVVETPDNYGTSTDQMVLEFATFTNLDIGSTESGSIQKVYVNPNGGYTDLPTVAVSSTTSGTGTKLIATTTDIGAAKSLKIIDNGFTYTEDNPPDLEVRAHFVVKDVSGTFAVNSPLTTHTGTVKGWDSTTQVLDTTFENVVRFEQEQSSTFNEGVQLEQGTKEMLPSGFLLENEQDFDDGEDMILDGTGFFTPTNQSFVYKVRVARNAADTANIFYINDEAQPTLTLFSGNTYYFDLSDSSLYNAVATSLHQLKFSETSDGTHNSGSAFTTGVTTSAAFIDIGTTGAFIQIVVPASAGQLYYYCVNHSGMGGEIFTPSYRTTIVDAGDNIIFNATQRGPNIALMLLTETGDVGANPADNVILEDDSGDLHLEETIDGQLADVGGKVKIDRYHETHDNQFVLLDGTNISGADDGDIFSSEELGDALVLERTDTDGTDARDKFLLDDETGNGQLIINATDSSLTDANGHIINQDPIDFSDKDVTITDSTGASATIITADIATGTTSVDVISTDTGAYSTINSRLGENLIRIQDSYYYQDYSYEVQVGQSFATYINELKRAVHPAGFQPFGKVTLATLVSAAIQTTGAGLSGYTGDTTTFSPILGSVLQTLFSQVLQSRLQVPTTHTVDGQVAIGSRDDSFIQEDGALPGAKLVLDGTAIGTNSATLDDVGGLATVDNPRHIILDGTDEPVTGYSVGVFSGGSAIASAEQNISGLVEGTSIEVGMVISTGDNTSRLHPTYGLTINLTNSFTDANGDNAVSRDNTVTVISVAEVRNIDTNLFTQVVTLSEPVIMGALVDLVFREASAGANILMEDGDLVTYESYLVASKFWTVRHIFNLHGFGEIGFPFSGAFDSVDYIGAIGHDSNFPIAIADQVAITVKDTNTLSITDADGHNAISTDGSLKLVSVTQGFNPEGLAFAQLTPNQNSSLTNEVIHRTGRANYYTVGNTSGAGFTNLDANFGTIGASAFGDVIWNLLEFSEPVLITGEPVLRTLLNTGDRIIEEQNRILLVDTDVLILDGTDGSSTDAGDDVVLEDDSSDVMLFEDGHLAVGDSILFEAATVTSNKDITSGTGDGAGKFMLETSHATSDKMDRALVTDKTISVISNPLPMYESNLLLYLADTPFGNVNGNCGITLESGAGNLTDSLILDGQLPFDEGDTFLVLNGTDASGTDAGDNIKINSSSTAPDGNLLGEDGFFGFPLGFRVDIGDRFLFDTNHNDETITLSDIGTLTFENIRRVDKINLSDTNDSLNWGGQDEEDGITMEDFGQVLLDGTDSSSTNAGHFLAQETTKRNRFTLEQSGSIIVEEFSTNSNLARFDISDGSVEINSNILFEDAINPLEAANIKLEYDDEEGIIILDATDSSLSDAGDSLDLEDELKIRNVDVVLLEENNVFVSEGHIPLSNYTLNSTSVITRGNVHSAEISVRSTGEVALEDATDTTHGFLLEETSGDNLDLEGATGITH